MPFANMQQRCLAMASTRHYANACPTLLNDCPIVRGVCDETSHCNLVKWDACTHWSKASQYLVNGWQAAAANHQALQRPHGVSGRQAEYLYCIPKPYKGKQCVPHDRSSGRGLQFDHHKPMWRAKSISGRQVGNSAPERLPAPCNMRLGRASRYHHSS
jgi:hypothetical protein